jgi:hypothetical protein
VVDGLFMIMYFWDDNGWEMAIKIAKHNKKWEVTNLSSALKTKLKNKETKKIKNTS